MTTASSLAEWKTSAWKDPGMVAWYSNQMVHNQGTNRLKNQLEVDLCLKYARGEDVLDVGIGTGRGSLPLAAQGFRVTGVDSSQAMLDETQRLARAGGLQLETRVALLDRLPFENQSFDSLISLNVMVHFPNWREILPEWARVVRPGGHLVFDVHSLDNYRAGLGRMVSEAELLNVEVGSYQLRVAAVDLVAEAQSNGLTVVDIVPYGAFLGGGNRNYLLTAIEEKCYWQRLLSWMAVDDAFLDFALFLERELVARLSSVAAGRVMVILEKRDDPDANRAWLAENTLIDAALRRMPLDLDGVSRRLSMPASEFKARIGAFLLRSPHSRRLVDLLATPVVKTGGATWDQLLSDPWAAEFADLSARRQRDAIALAISRKAPHGVAAVAHELDADEIGLGAGFEYYLMENVLSHVLGCFTGVRS